MIPSPASSRAVVPNLGSPDVLGLQLPEAFTTTLAGQDFWELKSKNIWRPKVRDHCSRRCPLRGRASRRCSRKARMLSLSGHPPEKVELESAEHPCCQKNKPAQTTKENNFFPCYILMAWNVLLSKVE